MAAKSYFCRENVFNYLLSYAYEKIVAFVAIAGIIRLYIK